MRAIVYSAYGSPDVLRCEDVEKPTAGDDDLVIRVRAASVNPYDWHVMRGRPYPIRIMTGLRKPTVPRLGVDVAGQVETAGRNVTRFNPGDEVFGASRGAFAEYSRASAAACVIKPAGVTFEQAASAPMAALTALQGLRDRGRIQSGQTVLINGASGGVGTFAVQVAKSFGAHVTGVCSTRNVALVRSIGADRAIDYTRQDFTRDGRQYDVILDCIGNRSLSACRRVLKPRGTYVGVGGPDGRWIGPLVIPIKALVLSPFVSQKMGMVMARLRGQGDLKLIGEFMASGKIAPVIDRRYTLSEVPQAIRYVEEGHARGKVVITVDDSGNPRAASDV